MPKVLTPSRAIPPQQYKFVEAMLYQYQENIDKVERYRESCMYGPSTTMPVVSRGHAYVSDPTARAAERMVDMPESVALAEQWIAIIKYSMEAIKAMDKETGGNLYDVCRGFYRVDMPKAPYVRMSKGFLLRELAYKLHMDERTIYDLRQQIVTFIWGVALAKGALTI